VVDGLVVGASQNAELLRESESEHEVVDRQKQTLLVFQPQLSLVILALGTVAMLAGMVTVMVFLALVTEIESSAKSLGAALLDLLHRPEMRSGHPVSEFCSVVGTVEAEDVGDLDHQRSVIRRLMSCEAICSALTVKWV
jgi:hypothetical protein